MKSPERGNVMPYIVETIITTRNHEGEVHIAPLGLIEDGADGAGMDAAAWIIAPFRPSRTLDNLLANGFAVANHVSDVRVFADGEPLHPGEEHEGA